MSTTKSTRPGFARPPLEPDESVALPRVLVVDDDVFVTSAFRRTLRSISSSVIAANDPAVALAQLEREEYDVVVADLQMPGMTGIELLRQVRARDLDLPVILVTGAPTIESAADAVELGAFRYLRKPVDAARLIDAVREAARLRLLARTKGGAVTTERRSELEAAFRHAVATLRLVYQPIVAADTRRAIGYEVLMRGDEPALPSPPAVFDAAAKLGALHLLGRRIRNLAAAEIDRARVGASFFVNLHPADLADRDLYDPVAPLSRCARQVVLELTERASLEGVPDLDARLEQLRELGYRLAVDDLGAGYAGLSYFAQVRPEIVKIDMSLVRNVDADVVRQRIVLSLVSLAKGLGMEVVAEGVETAAERDCVIALGCTFLQGYALARPGPAFPEVSWPGRA